MLEPDLAARFSGGHRGPEQSGKASRRYSSGRIRIFYPSLLRCGRTVYATGDGDLPSIVSNCRRYTGAGLAELGRWLANFTAETRNMAVAIEVPHGPVVDLLLDRGFVVYAINPKQLDRLRDRFSIAGSKDDRRDALVAASSLRTDSHLFRRVQASDPAIIELREWSRLAEELQQDRVRLCNRLRQQLWRYYPQFLELVDDMAAEWLLELWTMAPTPERAIASASSDDFPHTHATSDSQVRRRFSPRHPQKTDNPGGRWGR